LINFLCSYAVSVKQGINLKTIGVLYHPKVAATRKKADEIKAFLVSQGVSAWVCSSWDTEKVESRLEGTDLVITIGGDGTILRAARMTAARKIPIAGINLGKLGFMTEFDAGEAIQKLPELLNDRGWLDERAMLRVEVETGGKTQVYHALNDVVVARGEIARLIRIETSINEEPLTTYRTDGLIIATATGSTGYALAAGGPIIYPQSQDIILVPIAPHLCLDRALVMPGQTEIKLIVDTYQGATLSVDGHVNLKLSGGDKVSLKRSDLTTRFLRIQPEGYFFRGLEARLYGKRFHSRKSENH
jgi:NAD+ kinase